MNDNFLLNNLVDWVENAAAAGTSDTLTSDTVDTMGYDGVTFLAMLGDATSGAVLTLTAQGGSASNGSDAADLSGAIATFTAGTSDADNKVLAVEVVKPQQRYQRVTLDRATQNCVINGIVAILHTPSTAPCTQVDVIAATKVLSPA